MEKLRALIAEKIGFQIRSQDIPFFQRKIDARLKQLKIRSLDQYYCLLLRGFNLTGNNATERYKAVQEWQALANIITNGESFFFRDRGQFDLLKNTIIPQLIEQQRQLHAEGKSKSLTLKIWSAGCSSGEEVYSLAILVSELIPDIHQWNVSIIGTDINQSFLDLARQGIYKQWSFRIIDPFFQHKYFTVQDNSWQIKPNIKNLVAFYQDNLLETTKISHHTYNFDLVLCRNVFIYFNFKAITKAVEKISSTLRPGGFFMPGHTELQAADLNDFEILSFPNSLIYQYLECDSNFAENKGCNIIQQASILASDSIVAPESFKANSILPLDKREKLSLLSQPKQQKTENSDPETKLKEIQQLLDSRKYELLLLQAERLLNQVKSKTELYYIVAQSYLEIKQLDRAKQECDRALKIDPLDIKILFLLTEIETKLNNFKKAKELLKRIIYLEPLAVSAYFYLGEIYSQEKDLKRANKMYSTTRELIQSSSEQIVFAPRDKRKARDLSIAIKSRL